ncbi:MAG: nucleotidyltransferase family protein [Cyclobacteriaceae bacterium]|nr:nucleotidyltransferase family protein [Cyclobacteriaceae bacterium]
MMTVEEIKHIVKPILSRNQVKRASLFGSHAKKTNHPNSDIDILVELDDSMSLLDFVGIKLELEDALQRKVDLVEYDAIKPALRKSILKSEVSIYG